jgi:ubiquinone/menaquinone biosynthesis C-methylase UbiE
VEMEEYARIAAAEDEHWWYRSTRALCASLLEPWLTRGGTFLDAGCGPGGNGAWLAQRGRAIGVDLAAEGLRYVRERRPEITPVQASITDLPFPDAAFDAVLEITVVTCLTDDARAVAELARVVRPGGALLLFEPAFASLRRAHDKTVHSLHRYRRHQLASLATAAGLQVERSTYVYSFLTPPAAVLAAADRITDRPASETGSDVEKRALDRVFAPLAGFERRWLRRGAVPFGSSVIVLASRPS